MRRYLFPEPGRRRRIREGFRRPDFDPPATSPQYPREKGILKVIPSLVEYVGYAQFPVYGTELTKAMPPVLQIRVQGPQVSVGIDQPIQIHYRKAGKVANETGIPRPEDAALGQGAVGNLHGVVGPRGPLVAIDDGIAAEVNKPKGLPEIRRSQQRNRPDNHHAPTQQLRRPLPPGGDELTNQIYSYIAPRRNNQRRQQVGRNIIPGELPMQGGMLHQPGLNKLGDMADAQAEYAGQKSQQQPVPPAFRAAGQPPNQRRIDADLQGNQQLIAEYGNLQRLPEIPEQAVAALQIPPVLRPGVFDRAAHRNQAVKDQPVIGKINQDAGYRPQERKDHCRRNPGTPSRQAAAGLSILR